MKKRATGMKKNALSLDQVMYKALRSDFEEDRQHIDAVLSFYDEARAQVVYSVGCHRIALSAKSSLLQQLLIDHQVEGQFRQYNSLSDFFVVYASIFFLT